MAQNAPRPVGEEGETPDPPGEPQDPPRRLPDPSRTPPDALPDPPGRPKMLFRSIWPNDVFRKNQKLRTRRKHVEKKSRQRSSTVVTRTGPHKNRKHFHNGRNPEGGGGGRAKRSSIRRPQRSMHGRHVNAFQKLLHMTFCRTSNSQ